MPVTSVRSDHDAVACRARRHSRAQYLVTADESALPELEMLLATLPLCATGRVFIEVPDSSWIAPVSAPARMTVTWLDRSTRRGIGGPCRTGAALTRAAIAYADEVICEQTSACGTNVTLLGGFVSTADIAEHLIDNRGVHRSDITVREALNAYV